MSYIRDKLTPFTVSAAATVVALTFLLIAIICLPASADEYEMLARLPANEKQPILIYQQLEWDYQTEPGQLVKKPKYETMYDYLKKHPEENEIPVFVDDNNDGIDDCHGLTEFISSSAQKGLEKWR